MPLADYRPSGSGSFTPRVTCCATWGRS